jgi:hypothetical protein
VNKGSILSHVDSQYSKATLKEIDQVYQDTSKVTPKLVRNSDTVKKSMENSEGGNKSLFYEFDFNEDLTQMNIEEPIGNLKRQEERSK